ncbi:MAG: MoaD/ThiS family protein [Desulfobacterales bacterium]|jgi:sulfur carrier protein ThiS
MKTLIDLRLFATLTQYLPMDSGNYAIPEDATVLDVIRSLGIPETEVKLAFVNSVQVSVDTVLHGGDRLGLFPPVGGG